MPAAPYPDNKILLPNEPCSPLLLLLFFTLITASSCKKETTDPVTILSAHTWYPYQTHITATDSTLVTDRSTGTTITRRYNRKWDTSFLNIACQQQSSLQFQQGGNYQISNNCNASVYNAQWGVLPSNTAVIRAYIPLSSIPAGGYPAFGFGDILQADIQASQFILKNYNHSVSSMSTGPMVYDSTTVKDTLWNIICRSR